ncbi:hypothetical protein F4780DRAFT_417692 [Xylariomycetidae sp. FL0641]|nr:hypothetical protein F4780DRAFT_417692 [Xylariomycetidae sp. FL0641]
MSSSDSVSPDSPNDITYITPEPFTPRPLIADIIRTRFCVPGSIFLVEGVDSPHTSRSRRWRLVRLLLGDGELCIQALLPAELHRYVDRGEVAFGSYIKLESFRLGWESDRTDSAPGASGDLATRDDSAVGGSEEQPGLVYLVVEDLVLVGWNNVLVDTGKALRPASSGRSTSIHEHPITDAHAQAEAQVAVQPPPGDHNVGHNSELLEETEHPGDDFEVMADPGNKVIQGPRESNEDIDKRMPAALPNSTQLAWSSRDPTKPLKLTKLRSIPNLPYKQNWSVNVLAVVSAISDLEPSALPPYSQRQARLADPSTDKHVLLTVFLDPEQFTPSVGSVVLLLGVKNHRFDGGSLKKYVSDRSPGGEPWWYENPRQFPWCDVESLQQWKMGTRSSQ